MTGAVVRADGTSVEATEGAADAFSDWSEIDGASVDATEGTFVDVNGARADGATVAVIGVSEVGGTSSEVTGDICEMALASFCWVGTGDFETSVRNEPGENHENGGRSVSKFSVTCVLMTNKNITQINKMAM